MTLGIFREAAYMEATTLNSSLAVRETKASVFSISEPDMESK